MSWLSLIRNTISANRSVVLAIVALALGAPVVAAQGQNLADRLGYSHDAKLLILHADDLAVANSVDRASFTALESKAVSSASVMVPCPWLTEVAEYFQRHPETDLGLHLTLTSEWKNYRWRPVTASRDLSSLLDGHGYLWVDDPSFSEHADPKDVEREVRSQIERALALGIHPTHLDSHMGTLFLQPRYFAVLVKLAHEYGLPFLTDKEMTRMAGMGALLAPNDIVLDSRLRIELKPPVPGEPDDAKQRYLDALRELQPGVHEIIVHLGYDDPELRAIMVDHPDFGSAWRQRDYEIVTSTEFRHALTENHITLTCWRELAKARK